MAPATLAVIVLAALLLVVGVVVLRTGSGSGRERVVCRACGHSNAAEALFCGRCGHPLQGEGSRLSGSERSEQGD